MAAGIVTMLKEHTVCTAGQTLTPEQARILKLLDVAMVEFKVTLLGGWAASSGAFKRYVEASGDAAMAGSGSDDGDDDEDDE